MAARFAPWALCEDTGGSCRAPAIANGIFGLRPTLGCYNYSDALVLATFTRDTVGELLLLFLRFSRSSCIFFFPFSSFSSSIFYFFFFFSWQSIYQWSEVFIWLSQVLARCPVHLFLLLPAHPAMLSGYRLIWQESIVIMFHLHPDKTWLPDQQGCCMLH